MFCDVIFVVHQRCVIKKDPPPSGGDHKDQKSIHVS